MRTRFFLLSLLWWAGCREAYEPPAIRQPNRYLVVEGVINAAPNAATVIYLSRTRNLAAANVPEPETGATVQIESQTGGIYPCPGSGAGRYTSSPLTLSASDRYRLRIRTADGQSLLSDFVPVKETPPIDSLMWKQEGDVTVFVSTKDPSNRARYYRWDFTETWQYRSYLLGNFGLGVANGQIFFKDQNTQTNYCWTDAASTKILLANTVRLSQDVVDRFPVAVVPSNSEKIGIRYSVLVRQYALTEDAYNYWEILQKNTEKTGGVLDAQPGQLRGNIRNTTNTAEPVIGYATACTVQEKRLFVAHSDLVSWDGGPPVPVCQETLIQQNPVNAFIWDYPDTTFGPWYFVTPGGIMIAKKDCIDCTRRGGSNQKPAFW